ncbi:unnamed protein product [Symbiodinium pilosum]|uniref:Uncharacterized protein n=1 Tax=Symbiodinium pilosum TaxID=2952 RepID=A0A812M1C5_SYMPI|nr:unnamed protein product [Symbiodinium pilosum]
MAVERLGPVPLEFRLFNACGIPIYVHIFLVAFFVWRLSDEEAAAKRSRGLPDYRKAAEIALTCCVSFAILFLTVLIHELGHCAGAKLVGGRVSRILLWPLGGLAFCSSGGGAKGDLVVALAGPMTPGPQYLAWLVLYKLAVQSQDELGHWAPMARDHPPCVQPTGAGVPAGLLTGDHLTLSSLWCFPPQCCLLHGSALLALHSRTSGFHGGSPSSAHAFPGLQWLQPSLNVLAGIPDLSALQQNIGPHRG